MANSLLDQGPSENDRLQFGDEQGRKIVTLGPNEEWRFEVSFEYKMTVRLIEGSAELFGTELARGREYEMSGQKGSVFTFHGCMLEWDGKCKEYSAQSSTPYRYVNIHFALERIRRMAHEAGREPPRVMIIGPKHSGKSTLAKVLVSYGTKMGRFPLLVNLDPSAPVFSPPGSLVAAPVSHILDIEEGFGQAAVNGPAATHHKQPLVYNYGLSSPPDSPRFFELAVSELASGVAKRTNEDIRVRESGIIIDTPSSFADVENESNSDILVSAATNFGINAVIVVGDNDLAGKVRNLLPAATDVVVAPRSEGATEVDDVHVRQSQRRSIGQYFFGSSRQALSPFTVTVPLSEVTVYRPLERAEYTDTGAYLQRVEPSAVLQNCLLAVVNAEPTDSEETIAHAETIGYVHIVEADETKKILKILMPVPGKVPCKALIMGTYRYHE